MNGRPSAPKADALPGCATPRHSTIVTRIGFPLERVRRVHPQEGSGDPVVHVSLPFVCRPGPVMPLNVPGFAFDMRAGDSPCIFDEFVVHLDIDRVSILLPRVICIRSILIGVGQRAICQKIEDVVIPICLHNGPGGSGETGSDAVSGGRIRILR